MKAVLKKCFGLMVRFFMWFFSLPGAFIRWYFSCRMVVRVVLTVVIMLLLTAAISAGRVYLMFHRHVTVPFEAMGLSDDYRPGFFLDANHIRAARRVLQGQKPEDDPWEKDYPLFPKRQQIMDAEVASATIPDFPALKKYMSFCDMSGDFEAIAEYSKIGSKFFYDFAAIPEDIRNRLDKRIMELLDLRYEDFLDLASLTDAQKKRALFDFERGYYRYPAAQNVSMYLAWKRTQNSEFDAGKAFSALLRYQPLEKALISEHILWPEGIAHYICYPIYVLCRDGHLKPEEAVQIISALDEVNSRTLNAASDEALAKMLDQAKTRLLYLYRLSPFGTWLLTSIYPDPLEICRKRFRLFTIVPTVAAEKEFAELPWDFLGLFDFRRADAVEMMIYEARSLFKYRVYRAILQQELAQIAGLDRLFPDPYTGSPLCRGEINGRQAFYSCGPNQKDDGMTGDDIFYEK